MKCLLIGGAGQGKLAYASEAYAIPPQHVGRCTKQSEALSVLDFPVVHGLHHLVWALLKHGQAAQEEILARLDAREDWIVICDEVGCGVVPVEAFTREWRECVGRICCALAQRADRVERVFCGLPQVLKP